MDSRKLIFGLFLMVAVAAAGTAYIVNGHADSIPWTKDYEGSLAKAKSSNTPMITYLYTDSCTYCKQMEATTFQDKDLLADMVPRYIWVKLNAETDPVGARLNREFGVESYPTLVLMDPAGEEVDRLVGYVPAPDFTNAMDSFQTSQTSFGNVRRAAEAFPDSIEAQYALGEKYLERNHFALAAMQFAKVVKTDPENKDRLTDASYYFFAFALASGRQAPAALDQIAALEERFPKSRFWPDAAFLRAQILYFGGKPQEAKKIFEEFADQYPQHPNANWALQLAKDIGSTSAVSGLASSH